MRRSSFFACFSRSCSAMISMAGLFSRLCILLFSLGFRQDAVTERLDRSILRHYGKKRPRQHTRCVNNYSLASRRVVVSRDIARRLKPRELKTIIFFHYVPRCAVALHTRSPRRTRTSFVSHRTIKSRSRFHRTC
jgi:hypothetical protein